VDAAVSRVRATFGPYRLALHALPEPLQNDISAYVGALGAEAAARRNEAKRLTVQLDALRAEGMTR
jgi:hypothetical protein